MLVPKGRVLVIVAVDQLADVRRTAGQTDDDARNAAKVELKVEFYNPDAQFDDNQMEAPGQAKPTQFSPSVGGLRNRGLGSNEASVC